MITSRDQLPGYLQKYIVEQDEARYTPVDQLVWKYIIRQLKSFLKENGHPIYLQGMAAAGINEKRIPLISEISSNLQKFGWTALPVSGFIPPAAFMELQSLGILPIATDMRTMGHLMYTPAPDIVHEAAGHAPILIDAEYSDYLRQYSKVAKRAIISQEDLDIYQAIRELSDIKEDPNSTPADIERAENKLQLTTRQVSHISEATQLSRMNWWTAEYGLVGTLENPKIFGAGLLSSLGESRLCLQDKVKKLPLSVDCIHRSYDITEPQPQLYVTPNFKTLKDVLDEMSKEMAFRKGGSEGLKKAQLAKTVNTAELNTGLQISGVFLDPICVDREPAYIKLSGPTQICYGSKEIEGHDKFYHGQGFGTPIGNLKNYPQTCPSQLSDQQWLALGLDTKGILSLTNESMGSNEIYVFPISTSKQIVLTYKSGIEVTGQVTRIYVRGKDVLMMSLLEARANYKGEVLFDPSWGTYDIVLANKVDSVYGGPADYEKYGEKDDFLSKRVEAPRYSDTDKLLHHQYELIAQWVEDFESAEVTRQIGARKKAAEIFHNCLEVLNQNFKQDWLLRLEILEYMLKLNGNLEIESQKLIQHLKEMQTWNESYKQLISDGLNILGVPE